MKPYKCVDCGKPMPDGGTWCSLCQAKDEELQLQIRRETEYLRLEARRAEEWRKEQRREAVSK